MLNSHKLIIAIAILHDTNFGVWRCVAEFSVSVSVFCFLLSAFCFCFCFLFSAFCFLFSVFCFLFSGFEFLVSGFCSQFQFSAFFVSFFVLSIFPSPLDVLFFLFSFCFFAYFLLFSPGARQLACLSACAPFCGSIGWLAVARFCCQAFCDG